MKLAPFIILTGASGAGKSSVLEKLLADPSLGLVRFVTHTTRPPRPGETDGVEYHFTDRATFEADREAGKFFEWANVYGQLYGSHRDALDAQRKLGRPLITIVDVQGATVIKQALPDTFVIFIDAPKEHLKHRLEARGSAIRDMRERLAKIDEEQALKSIADVYVENRDGALEQTTDIVTKLIKERL